MTVKEARASRVGVKDDQNFDLNRPADRYRNRFSVLPARRSSYTPTIPGTIVISRLAESRARAEGVPYVPRQVPSPQMPMRTLGLSETLNDKRDKIRQAALNSLVRVAPPPLREFVPYLSLFQEISNGGNARPTY